MFNLLAKFIIRWKNDLKKRTTWQERLNKAWNSINTNEVHHYYHNSTGTSSTKLDPEQEKRAWDAFDNSFRVMDDSFKIMDESFKHMGNIFNERNCPCICHEDDHDECENCQKNHEK